MKLRNSVSTYQSKREKHIIKSSNAFCTMATKDSLDPGLYTINGPTLKPFDVINTLRESKEKDGYTSKPFFEVLDGIFLKEMAKATVDECIRVSNSKEPIKKQAKIDKEINQMEQKLKSYR